MRQKAGQLMAFDPSTPDREAQKARCKCGYADKWPSCQNLSLRACRPVEHPSWNLQPTICLRSIQRAAENDIISLVNGPMNANSATKPRMMPIKNLAKNGPVGVLKRCCTMAADRTRALTTPHRIKPTSTSRQSAWQPNPGRGSTYRRGKSVQTTGTSSSCGSNWYPAESVM